MAKQSAAAKNSSKKKSPVKKKSKSKKKSATQKSNTPKTPKNTPQSSDSCGEESGANIFEQFSEALLTAGAKAERLGRWGVTKVEKLGKLGLVKAELEREKFGLAKAYEDVGREVVKAYLKSPRKSLKASDKQISNSLKTALDLW